MSVTLNGKTDSLPTKALTITNKGKQKTPPLQCYRDFLHTQK